MIKLILFLFLMLAKVNLSYAWIEDLAKFLTDPSIPTCDQNRSDRCIHTWPNGDKYIGVWDGNSASGRGHAHLITGEKYWGFWKNNKRNGEGENHYPNGDVARGNWKDDLLYGFGSYIYKNGQSVSGNWQEGKLEGFGTWKYPDGRMHTGYFKNGERNGKFNQISPNGSTEIVFYSNGKVVNKNEKVVNKNHKEKQNKLGNKKICDPKDEVWNHCYAKYTFEEEEYKGEVYEGEWLNNQQHGIGTYFFNRKNSKGDVYKGEWKNGKQHGYGEYNWASGAKYIGYLENDMIHGQGTYFFEDGRKYTGNWHKDKMQGHGILSWKEGDRYEGEFYDNKMQGHGKYTYPDGSYHVGENKNDKANGYGKFVQTGKDAFTYTGEFKDNLFHGHGKLVYKNGKILEGEFKNDMFQGKSTETYATSKRSESGISELLPWAIGSAFFINSEGYAITNHHVIANECKEIKGKINEKEFSFNIIGFDEKNDLAILKTKKKKNEHFLRIANEIKLGENIIVGGFPYSENLKNYNIKVTQGIVSALSGVQNNFSEIQIDAAIQSGNSGGPVVNSQGQLVAVTTYKYSTTLDSLKEDINPENMGFGKKNVLVQQMLSSNNIEYNEFELWKSKPKNTAEIAEILSLTTSQVYCLNTKDTWNEIAKKSAAKK